MILCNLGVFQMMILRFNLSMAIVCMTDSKYNGIDIDETNLTYIMDIVDSDGSPAITTKVCNNKKMITFT
jgi:hypothetical protein